jgi:hypothetical protein
MVNVLHANRIISQECILKRKRLTNNNNRHI